MTDEELELRLRSIEAKMDLLGQSISTSTEEVKNHVSKASGSSLESQHLALRFGLMVSFVIPGLAFFSQAFYMDNATSQDFIPSVCLLLPGCYLLSDLIRRVY